jgi:hypothetical protein
VVVFDAPDIQAVLVEGADPGKLFDKKLRDVYDHV